MFDGELLGFLEPPLLSFAFPIASWEKAFKFSALVMGANLLPSLQQMYFQ